MSDLIVGIDLGTTNSEVAAVRDGSPVVLAEDGDPILPSVVGLAADGRLLVGHAARNQYILAPERTVKSIKRRMGEDTTVTVGDQSYRPQEISAMILRSLRDRAARQLAPRDSRGGISKAVITVPAYFNDAQRQATREAGELAGLEVVRILNEPTAAALAYEPGGRDLRRVLVYDLGGGTFDVSVVAAEGGVVEVLASHGDTHLGGDDFDDLLLALVCDRFADEHGIDLRANLVAKARLLRAVEAAKRQLSDHPFARIEEEFVAEKNGLSLHLAQEISRDDYENLIRPLIDRTMDCVQRALDDAALTGRAIDQVVLVGGSTRTPLIAHLLEDRLGQPAHKEVNPDLIVAMGAALQGAIIAGADVGSVLVDVTPHSLGIKCFDDAGGGYGMPFLHRFAPIIDRNTPLPASRSEVFRTVEDRQPTVEIDVYQGEDDDVRRNHRVGRFLVEGLAHVAAGNQIVVQLDLNLDGMLTVSAREKGTGLQKRITIDNALARYEREEFDTARERLDEMWATAFDDQSDDDEPVTVTAPAVPELVAGPREGQRETVQARALLEKADRLLVTVQPEDRSEVERLMEKVRTALTDRRWTALTAAANELADALFYLEDA
jgi:molecular chaperone DnaK